MASQIGELAALATAICWAVSALCFELAGRRIGSLSVNLIRLVAAMGLLALYGAVTRGHWLPSDASTEAWIYLGISGLIGFLLGDLCLFRAFIIMGARLSTLVAALWPAMAAVMSWLVLGESLTGWDVLGMSLTIIGIAIAILERAPPGTGPAPGNLAWGIVLALLGALGQAGGLVLSKLGMGDYDPVAATHIRIIAGVVGFAVLLLAIGWLPTLRAGLADRRAMGQTLLGALFGPAIGVSLSLIAVKYTAMGVGAAIMATSPIMIIPLVVVIRRERVGPLAVFGSLVAVAGVAVLFLL